SMTASSLDRNLVQVLPVHSCHCLHNGGLQRDNADVRSLLDSFSKTPHTGPYLLRPEHGQIVREPILAFDTSDSI
ncbi:Transposable element tcb2 transposase, partial [Caligus rogercresseyi]